MQQFLLVFKSRARESWCSSSAQSSDQVDLAMLLKSCGFRLLNAIDLRTVRSWMDECASIDDFSGGDSRTMSTSAEGFCWAGKIA
jgi:hypothetical protein